MCETSGSNSQGKNTLLERRKLTGTLEKLPVSVTGESVKCEDDIVPNSQDTVLMVSDDENSIGVKGSGSRIISNVRLPRELRLCVVDGDIVNSPVTAVETSMHR